MRAPDPAPLQLGLELKPTPALYFAVGLEAGAVIALQICIMRTFAVGSWPHFGSLVVSLAMLGFGLTSAVMCIGKAFFDRHWRGVVTLRSAPRRTALGAQRRHGWDRHPGSLIEKES